MTKNANDTIGDRRLKKSAGTDVRGSRDSADVDRVQQDGLNLSSEERRRMLRQEWVQEVLPSPPKLDGFHCCWLSTTNATDPVYKRIQLGYVPVKATEVPGFGSQFTAQGGEFDGCVICNEMLLFKVPLELYNDLMTIYHHDMPMEQEEGIRENVTGKQATDSSGKQLASVEGSFKDLARPVRAPNFIS